jgi:creatinine amidohydrolase
MQLQLSTWPQVQDYLKRSKGCIVPIGSTEQHGPTGPIGTDAICAECIAAELGRAADALVAPTIGVGMSVHHTAFPGSMTMRPSVLQAVIRDYVFCLAAMGIERFFFVNGHGGNEPSIQAAFWEIHALAPAQPWPHTDRIRLAFESWWKTPATAKLLTEIFGDKDGGHATPGEISVAMHAHPECDWRVDQVPAGMTPDMTGRRLGYGPIEFQRLWPDGRIHSDPSLARPEHGARLVAACAADLKAKYMEFQGMDDNR